MARPEARPLRVTYIDDHPTAIPAPGLEIKKLRGLHDVQQWMVDAARLPPDIVVCDVNMERRHRDHPKGVNWGTERLPAYGPILALPFLASDTVCEFVPISSWWSQVENDGYVLVPVALLLTTIARRPYTLRRAREWISEQASPRETLRKKTKKAGAPSSPTARALGSTDPLRAIASGLDGLRRKLTQACEDGRLTLAGLDSTIEALRLWTEGAPVEGDGGPARIEILYPDRSDYVRVTSLFADGMAFRDVPSREEVARIIAELESWRQKDICFRAPRSSGLYEQAVRLLTDRFPRKPKDKKELRTTTSLKERARTAAAASGIDPNLLVRVAIIFAFLRAWYFAGVCTTVCDDEGGAYGVLDWAYWFLDIDPRRGPYNPFKRLLGREVGRKIVMGTGEYQKPFDESAKSPFEAYSALKRNEPLSLTTMEKSLGRRFIEDEDRFFPSELDPAARIPWEPHLDDQIMSYPAWLTCE